jgi:general secretion pathway protein L
MRTNAHSFRIVQKFWRWWIMELWMMVPARVRRQFGRRRNSFVVAFEGDGAALMRETGSEQTVLASINFSAIDTDLRRLMAANHQAKARVRVRLASQQALRTIVSLPLPAEENLQEVLGFELDRKTPFRASDVYFTHRVERRDREAQSLSVALTVVPRRNVDAAMGAVRKLGLEPDGVEIATPTGGAAEPLPLHETVAARPRRIGLAVRGAIGGLFLASAVAAFASTNAGSDQRDAFTRKVSEARLLAAKAQDIRDRIAALENERSTSAQNANRLHGNALLSELTRLLPDDTWLDRLSLSTKKVTMSGHSASSSNVIRVLEGSELFASPTFDAPVTPNSETGKDEFTLSASMRGGK